MSKVTDDDIGTDFWATTDMVQDRFTLEINNQEPTHRERIKEATNSIQADWAAATGKSYPDDVPADPPDLLTYAVADLAASDAHLNFAQNIANENDGDERHVFLENRSERHFKKWKQTANLKSDGRDSDYGPGTVRGRSGSLTDDIIDRGAR